MMANDKLMLDSFKEQLLEMCDHVFMAQECLAVVEYLLKPEIDKDLNILKTRDTYLRWSKHMNFRIAVIELHKLYNRKESFNILTFIDDLKQGGAFAKINIPNTSIEKWTAELASLEDAIKKNTRLRHTSFAHTASKKPKVELTNVTVDECKELVELTRRVMIDIYAIVFHSTLGVGIPDNPLRSLKKITETIVDVRKKEQQPLRKLGEKYGLSDI